MSGADPDFRSSGAQNSIHWEAIKHFYGKVKYFDFEGSMIENVEANFRKFGCVQKQYFHIYKPDFKHHLKSLIKYILGRS